MITAPHSRRAAAAILLATLLVRASIPDGYMPAAPGSGLLFELCPTGMPAGFGESPQHAHHHHDAATSSSQVDPEQCPIGHMLAAAVAVGDFWQLAAVETLPVYWPTPVLPVRSRFATAYRSRDPPA